MLIYILEDDASIRKLVTYTLEQAGFSVMGFERPSEFWRELERHEPELVLLDIMLPEEDGLSVLHALRSRAGARHIPVVMMTAKNSEYDRVIGLDSGADDYISKPFGMMELVARVRAVLRRSDRPAINAEYRMNGLYVSPERHEVRVNGEPVILTKKEFELLCLLLKNSGSVMKREVIMDSVWGTDFDGENRTVDVHIRTLRAKLGTAGQLIETIRGVGYRAVEKA